MDRTAEKDVLFTKGELGAYSLPHRVIMAPLTRSRSKQPGNIPTEMNAKYYAQRSSAALIISEATQISPQGMGYAFTPGIHSNEQIEGWKKVTKAVHEKGSKIFLQMWHVGRISHSSLQPEGALPVAPSAIKAEGEAFTYQGLVPFETPRALETEEIPGIIQQYEQAARNAKEAGFDGVEVHAANGYLLDQFLRESTNKRTDAYGGSIENRSRLLLEVIEAVTSVWGPDKVGIRISPTGTFNSITDSDPEKTFGYLVDRLNLFGLAYLHVVEAFGEGPKPDFDFNRLRKSFQGPYIANGGYTADSARESLISGKSDFIAFGTKYIANPDLVERFKLGAPLNEADPNTFYGGNEKGYIDYPFMEVNAVSNE
ncbi:alkene reductase [Xanthovirga aplysinae]|uniref:alkene reductase n=1 Tax=Xanthovirga aplysinae TaxID=2529853 RepID=UPI0012BB6FB5|nr:alkene reductase [Xanthovirga aplysinae]MTI29929.1 alkene reductase [Xanthovirga aplysinae]